MECQAACPIIQAIQIGKPFPARSVFHNIIILLSLIISGLPKAHHALTPMSSFSSCDIQLRSPNIMTLSQLGNQQSLDKSDIPLHHISIMNIIELWVCNFFKIYTGIFSSYFVFKFIWPLAQQPVLSFGRRFQVRLDSASHLPFFYLRTMILRVISDRARTRTVDFLPVR